MTPAELLIDALERVRDGGVAVVDGLGEDDLARRPQSAGDPANTIAWLVWHLARVQDDHVADVAGHEQVWTRDGWADRFGLPFEDAAIGFGHSTDEVGEVRAGGDLLAGYLRAVHEQTAAYVAGLVGEDLDRIVDEQRTPPVSLGVRLNSVADDGAQHVGQAAFVRGLLSR